ncbi:hypothetical protein ACIBI4_32540 [Streptomyces sp. NPDC050418]|uniref:hypothetical protein n=1 Tax=Streptomyces sp. NPDC050418 TaxID=3365612 RepID=UPI003790D1ED
MSSSAEHIPSQCPGCLQKAHEAAEKEQEADKKRQEAEDRAAQGPIVLWGCVGAVLILAIGSVIPYLILRYG